MTDLAERPYGFYSTAPKPAVDLGGLPPGDPRHGTINGYGNHNCRCDDCKAANAAYQRQLSANRRALTEIPERVHGTDNGYCRYYCKCDACSAAHREVVKRSYTPSPRRALEREKTAAMYADHCDGLSIKQVAEKWGVSVNSVYTRFGRSGLSVERRSTMAAAAAMYIDYCTGMSTAEVAEKWGTRPATVTRRFKELGVPLRPRRGRASCVVPVPDGVPWEDANRIRTEEAGVRRAHAAQLALKSTVDPIPRQVLELRIAHPRMSLAELGKRCEPPMTKDAYASHLRRALINAGVAS